MRRLYCIAFYIIAIILSFLLAYYLGYALLAIIPGAFLGVIEKRSIRISAGFVIGFLSSILLYLSFPSLHLIAKETQLISGIPYSALIAIFPLIFGVIEASSAGFFGEVLQWKKR
ncbi:MAG: hypothetical protein G5Z42_04900 [Caldisphaeraceae archaeon]|nr:hypothetical protein [Caldisphaeraceae archaeon]